MQPNFLRWIDGLWITFVVIWILSAMKTKRVARRLTGPGRFVQSVLTICGAILLFGHRPDIGWLNSRFLSDGTVYGYAGVAMTAGGIAFAVWARFALGQNWSGWVTLKQGHELVRSGPYGLVRHPIYSGALLALLGTAICVGEFRGLFGFGLFVAGLWLKSRTEEALMLEQFGEQYRRYQSEVKALIPFVL